MVEIVPVLFHLPIVLPLGAVFLRLAVKLATKFDVPFGRACLIVFVQFVVTAIFKSLVDDVAARPGVRSGDIFLGANVLLLPVYFCAVSTICGAMIIQPASGRAIGFRKGMLVALMLLLITVAIGLFLYGICAIYMR